MRKLALIFVFAFFLYGCNAEEKEEKNDAISPIETVKAFYQAAEDCDGGAMTKLLSSGIKNKLVKGARSKENPYRMKKETLDKSDDELVAKMQESAAGRLKRMFGMIGRHDQQNFGSAIKDATEKIDGDKATVNCLKFNIKTKFNLVKEDGEWKIDDSPIISAK